MSNEDEGLKVLQGVKVLLWNFGEVKAVTKDKGCGAWGPPLPSMQGVAWVGRLSSAGGGGCKSSTQNSNAQQQRKEKNNGGGGSENYVAEGGERLTGAV